MAHIAEPTSNYFSLKRFARPVIYCGALQSRRCGMNTFLRQIWPDCVQGGEHARMLAGFPVRGASAREKSRSHRHHDFHPHPRDRSDHRYLQRRLWSLAAPSALFRRRPRHAGLWSEITGPYARPFLTPQVIDDFHLLSAFLRKALDIDEIA